MGGTGVGGTGVGGTRVGGTGVGGTGAGVGGCGAGSNTGSDVYAGVGVTSDGLMLVPPVDDRVDGGLGWGPTSRSMFSRSVRASRSNSGQCFLCLLITVSLD